MYELNIKTKKKIGIGKAHSKIILMGEHSVVYGYPAIAIPLKQIKTICKITKSNKKIEFNYNDTLSMAVYYALKYIKIRNAYIKYEVESEIPSRRGMGSSAAVSIAAIRSVFDYYNQKLTYKILTYLVNKAEKVAHGNPSGLDAKTCMSNKAIKFIKNKGLSMIDLDLNAYLLIADTGIYGQTKEAVEKVKELGEKAIPILGNIGLLTNEVEKNIREKKLEVIGENMTNVHEELKKLGVSCKKSDNFVEKAIENGALGAKMSGGGLGGCVIVLIENEEKVKKIEEKLKKLGAVRIWIEKL